MLKLNLGCGKSKMADYINIDIEPSCEPDVTCDFRFEKLPYEDNSVDEICMFHVIEHISKQRHTWILREIIRVLKPGGEVFIAFPEFLKCVENWKTNFRGQRQFWEATIFGRQLYPSDHHVCIMDSVEFKITLVSHGFKNVQFKSEPDQDFNTVFRAVKGLETITYESLLAEDITKAA